MRLTVSSITTSQILTLDLPSDLPISGLKACIADEVPELPAESQSLYHNGRALSDDLKTLEDYNMKDDDMIIVAAQTAAPQAPAGQPRAQQQQQQQQQQRQPARTDSGQDIESIRLQTLGNPRLMNEMREIDEGLAASINDPQAFERAFIQFQTRKREAERQRMAEIQRLNEDPFDVESQRKIEELIRQEQVMQNLQNALEHHPEVAFGRVTMLYIPVHVNGVFVKAFVDSGAQATIMSPDCAQRCGIMRLIDSRFSGIARGVGTAKILGRVHSAQIKIGNLHLPCSFTVMEGKSVELLLGLDMLKRHQAKIDLMENRLVIQDESVEFLPEAEIPKSFEEEVQEEPTVEGPGNTVIGGRSGAIVEIPQAQRQQQPVQGASGSLPSPPPLPDRSHQAPPPQRSFPEDHIQTLMGLGVSREQAVQALEIYGGNVDMAANSFFQ